MGKRSDFERIDKDFYRTIDPRAVEILQPFLNSIDGDLTYAEPCFGQGDLASSLEKIGMVCNWVSDIVDHPLCIVKDALTITKDNLNDCSLIITNPPWSRDILHPMIKHFSSLKPTWLLFDADWMHTRQSSEYIKTLCTHIVSVGRLRWIPDTTMSGKDNCSWYRFDRNKYNETIFYGRN